jgi:hypothetical protein
MMKGISSGFSVAREPWTLWTWEPRWSTDITISSGKMPRKREEKSGLKDLSHPSSVN